MKLQIPSRTPWQVQLEASTPLKNKKALKWVGETPEGITSSYFIQYVNLINHTTFVLNSYTYNGKKYGIGT